MPLEARATAGELKALLICPDRSKAAELLRLLGDRRPALIVQYAYPTGAALLGLLHTPGVELCLVDAESDPEIALRLIAEINARASGLPVVALLGASNPDLILRCLRQGAGEFLVRPFSAEQWEAVWERIARHRPAAPGPAQPLGRLLCVLPAKGACGATSLALNLAFQFKRRGGKRVLLADLDPLTGAIGFLLKLKSGYSFLDALTHAERLDADLWKVLINPCQGVDVLLSPEDPVGSGEDWEPAALLSFCRRGYELAVLDAGSAFGAWELGLARLADEVLLVATNELPALHAAQRALGHLQDHGVGPERLRVVINRYAPERGLPAESIETALGCPVFHTLPGDYETLQKALMDGKPAPPGSRFGKSVAALAERLNGEAAPARQGSLLSLLFGRR